MSPGVAVADGTPVDLADDRVNVGVLMAPPGKGEDLAAFAAGHYPVLGTTSFATMTTQALVIAGDQDWNPDFSDRRDWRADAYFLSPGPKSLLTLFGAEHSLGGVSAYDAAETNRREPRARRCATGARLGVPPHRALPRRLGVERCDRGTRDHAQPDRRRRNQMNV
jgi:hypothetical protein